MRPAPSDERVNPLLGSDKPRSAPLTRRRTGLHLLVVSCSEVLGEAVITSLCSNPLLCATGAAHASG